MRKTRQLISAGLLCFGAGSLYGWSGLSGAVENRFSVGATEVGEVFSLSILAFTAAMLIGPRLPVHFRGLQGAGVAGLLGAATTALATTAAGYGSFLLYFGLGLGASSGAVYVFVVEFAAESPNPGSATPIMVATFGLGGAVFGPLMRLLVGAGYDLAAIWPVTATLAAGASFALANRSKLTNVGSAEVPAPSAVPLPPGLAIMLWTVFAFGSMAGLMCLGLALTILADRGSSVWLQSFGLMALALANTSGRLVVSPLQSVVPPARITTAAALLSALGVLALLISSTPQVGVVALTVLAAGYGLMAAGIPVLTRSLIQPGQFRRIFPVVFTGWGVAGLLSPRLTGVIRDATGSFELALILCLVASVIAVGFSLLVGQRYSVRTRRST